MSNIKNLFKNKLFKWFIQHTLTIASCVLIVVIGVTLVAQATPLITTIGENIVTNILEIRNKLVFSDGTHITTAPVRTATIVVAAFDSRHTSKDQADFVADGTDDHIEIQAAINALPVGGGLIRLTEGTFNFGAVVGRAIDNVSIQGVGQATVINRDGMSPVFTAGTRSNWVFRDFKADAGGIEIAAATNWTMQNITMGVDYLAFKSDVVAKEWAIPIGRTATIVVAAHNSSPQSKAQADFVADGVDDQVEIQAAIDALPAAGGKVLLMEGVFNIIPVRHAGTLYSVPVAIYFSPSVTNITLKGQGFSTILRVPSITTEDFEIILIETSDCRIKNLAIDMNASGSFIFPVTAPGGIVIRGCGARNNIVSGVKIFGGLYTENIDLCEGSSSNIITGNITMDGSDGVNLVISTHNVISNNVFRNHLTEAIDINNSSFNTITNNTMERVTMGVIIRSHIPNVCNSTHNIITGNSIMLGISGEIRTRTGIELIDAGTKHNIISNNIIRDILLPFATGHGPGILSRGGASHNMISGNVITRITFGIKLKEGTNHTIVEGNSLENIHVDGISGNNINHVKIRGNSIRSVGWHGVRIIAPAINNEISGNFITEAGKEVHNSSPAINVAGSNSLVVDNMIRMGALANKSRYGIKVTGLGFIVKNNDLRDSGFTLNLRDLGTNNIIKYNQGHATENSGIATFSGGGTIFTIAHGLAAMSTVTNLKAKSADAAGNKFWSADATNITVTFITAPPAVADNVVIGWEAKVR